MTDGNEIGEGATSVNVIIADDNATNRFVLERLLKRLGLTASVASDGSEAVALAQMQQPTLVLMDIQMPKMDGIEAAILIRKICPDARVPIIAVTAYADSLHLKEFELADFDDLIAKPVTLDQLRQTLSKHLEVCGEASRPTA